GKRMAYSFNGGAAFFLQQFHLLHGPHQYLRHHPANGRGVWLGSRTKRPRALVLLLGLPHHPIARWMVGGPLRRQGGVRSRRVMVVTLRLADPCRRGVSCCALRDPG